MKIKKEVSLLIALLLCTSALFSQIPLTERKEVPPPKAKFTDRMFFGGGLSLQFGSTYTYIEVAPMIGYRATERLDVGLNLKYSYIQNANYPPDYNPNTYGGGPFARFFIYEGLFAHAEYEILNLDVPNYYQGFHRENITSVFLGGGYRQMIGNNAGFDILILYNINESSNSPYVNPVFRFGFAVGI